jgi:hypothetical protein
MKLFKCTLPLRESLFETSETGSLVRRSSSRSSGGFSTLPEARQALHDPYRLQGVVVVLQSYRSDSSMVSSKGRLGECIAIILLVSDDQVIPRHLSSCLLHPFAFRFVRRYYLSVTLLKLTKASLMSCRNSSLSSSELPLSS